MWWVAGTFLAIVVFCALVGWWKSHAELQHVAHENCILRLQNTNLRDLVTKLRARGRSSGAEGAAALLADVRDRDFIPATCDACGSRRCRGKLRGPLHCTRRTDANPLDDASRGAGEPDGAA